MLQRKSTESAKVYCQMSDQIRLGTLKLPLDHAAVVQLSFTDHYITGRNSQAQMAVTWQ